MSVFGSAPLSASAISMLLPRLTVLLSALGESVSVLGLLVPPSILSRSGVSVPLPVLLTPLYLSGMSMPMLELSAFPSMPGLSVPITGLSTLSSPSTIPMFMPKLSPPPFLICSSLQTPTSIPERQRLGQ